MRKRSYYIINGITLYRVIAAPFLLLFIITKQIDVFKWLLAVSFFTDAIDGFLARRFRVETPEGSKWDSLGDDLTVLMGLIGLLVFRFEFIRQEYPWLILVLTLFFTQVICAVTRYGSISTFHTYLAKAAAILQGSFLILSFFLAEPPPLLFYVAVVVTTLDLLEEILITFILRKPKSNVKGIYWILKQQDRNTLLFTATLMGSLYDFKI